MTAKQNEEDPLKGNQWEVITEIFIFLESCVCQQRRFHPLLPPRLSALFPLTIAVCFPNSTSN